MEAIQKAANVTSINDTGIADGEICLFNATNKDIRTSDKTIVTTIGADDLTIPTSKAVKDVTDLKSPIANPTFTGTATTPILKVTPGAAAGNLLVSAADGQMGMLSAGATTDVLIGGGAANPVWTAATGSGSPVRAASPTLSGTPASVTAAVDTNTTQIATTAFVLAQIGRLQTPANQACSGVTIPLTAHANFAIFEIGYINSSGEAALADADAAATMPVFVMATAAVSADASGRFMLLGLARNDSWTSWTVGANIYASGTAGGLTETAPTGTGKVVQVVGKAIATKIIIFNPSNTWIELS